jgi:hypothetical protein
VYSGDLVQYQDPKMLPMGDIDDGFKDKEELVKTFCKKIAKLHRDLHYCLEQLGFWCTYKVPNYHVSNWIMAKAQLSLQIIKSPPLLTPLQTPHSHSLCKAFC